MSATVEYESVIGLEVHVEIGTKSKLFCACKNEFHAPPNTLVCPVCLGMPGALPVMNEEMINASIKVGLALNCTISRWSKMDRKNYFYPDQAKNYQISQYDLPLSHDGYLDFDVDGDTRRVRITRAHVEEDTARNVHTIGTAESGVDFNRAGVPLLEIVTEPDLRGAEETHAFLSDLKQLLEYLGVSDCNMEEGSLRAEPNISIRPKGQSELGVKTEIKNVASFTGVRRAIEFEIKRQRQVIEDGGVVLQETRGWDAGRGVTLAQRSKESAHDYRYFPEPDLVPIVVDEAWENRIRDSLPELPRARRIRIEREHGLSEYDSGVITMTKAMADYFEETVAAGAAPKQAANWIQGDLRGLLAEGDTTLETAKVRPHQLAALIRLIVDNTISGKIAKALLPDMLETGRDPAELVEEKGLVQISGKDELEALLEEVISNNPGPVSDFKAGKKKAMGFLVGQMMKATKGQGNPKVVNELLIERLGKE